MTKKHFLQCLMLIVLVCTAIPKVNGGDYKIPENKYSNNIPRFFSKLHFNNPDEKKISKKYAELLKVDENEINRFMGLYKFIDAWLGTAYKWGGCDKRGIDCSCFVMTLFNDVFDIKIKRTAFTQFYDNDIALFRNRKQFSLGDLLFFKTNINRPTRNDKITHVGLYLANGYFIQSSSNGVNIASIYTGYWKDCLVAAGRLQEKYYRKSKLAMPQGEVETIKTMGAEDVQNQDFEPVPYPEDLDELKGRYAGFMGIDSNRIVVPEMFDFIDKYRYAPYSIAKDCTPGTAISGCLISRFYQDVLGLTIDADARAIAAQKYTTRLRPTDSVSAFDLVLLKTNKKLQQYDVAGICLYNHFFLHTEDNGVVISNLAETPYNNGTAVYYRIDDPLLKKGFEFIKEKRKDRLKDRHSVKSDTVHTAAAPGPLLPDTLQLPVQPKKPAGGKLSGKKKPVNF